MLKIAKMLRNRKGFTLVELMVVVVIIGILAAIAVPTYNGAQTAAKESAGDANARILNGAVIQYKAQNGVLPTEAQLLTFLERTAADFKYVRGDVNATATGYVRDITATDGLDLPASGGGGEGEG